MSITKTDILVYAHWLGMKDPILIGVLSAQQAKGKKAFEDTLLAINHLVNGEWL